MVGCSTSGILYETICFSSLDQCVYINACNHEFTSIILSVPCFSYCVLSLVLYSVYHCLYTYTFQKFAHCDISPTHHVCRRTYVRDSCYSSQFPLSPATPVLTHFDPRNVSWDIVGTDTCTRKYHREIIINLY